MKTLLSRFLVGALAFSPLPSFALTINLSDTGNSLANEGFRKAANIWESLLLDDVVVNIASGFESLGEGVIGQTGPSFVNATYSQFKDAVTQDVKSAADATMASGLPAGNSYSKLMNATWESANFYGNQSYVQSGVDAVELTRANAKALGLLDTKDSAVDAEIIFNRDFLFDFDSSDGISQSSLDFVGVALHEIGHSLGFTSGVDIMDYFSYVYGPMFSDQDYAAFTSPLDFARCSNESANKNADMDWTVGLNEKSFSFDGKCERRIENAWSTGFFQGDGNQTSHWKNDLGLGLMDPSASYGELLTISQLDLLAFDIIGWDTKAPVTPVTEPTGFGLALCLIILCFGRLNHRRTDKGSVIY